MTKNKVKEIVWDAIHTAWLGAKIGAVIGAVAMIIRTASSN